MNIDAYPAVLMKQLIRVSAREKVNELFATAVVAASYLTASRAIVTPTSKRAIALAERIPREGVHHFMAPDAVQVPMVRCQVKRQAGTQRVISRKRLGGTLG